MPEKLQMTAVCAAEHSAGGRKDDSGRPEHGLASSRWVIHWRFSIHPAAAKTPERLQMRAKHRPPRGWAPVRTPGTNQPLCRRRWLFWCDPLSCASSSWARRDNADRPRRALSNVYGCHRYRRPSSLPGRATRVAPSKPGSVIPMVPTPMLTLADQILQ